MKRIFIALALLASVNLTYAQVKPADAKKAVDAAEAASKDAKKATKVATWLSLGQSYIKAYDAPAGNLWAGAGKQELALVMGSEKPTATEQVTIQGQPMTKEVYSNKNLYFNANNQLAIIEVTKPVVPDALARAAEAYLKAYEVDLKGAKKKDICAALESIGQKYTNDAYTAYSFGNLEEASRYFELAADVVANEPVSKLDTSSVYNAGFTAWAAKDNDRAKALFKKCYDAGYYYEGGEVFAKLAEVDTLNTKAYLEEGFQKFPQSQSILIGLINYYLKSNESTDRLFELLDKAKENEPNNASLYYVEGNIRAQLGDREKAVAAYEKCAEINPEYEYGFIGEGTMYYNLAIELQTKAQEELDDAKYMELVKQFEGALKSCIAPFEKAFEITKDDGVKIGVSEYLKNAYYRFRDEGAEYQAGYDKYSKFSAEGRAQ